MAKMTARRRAKATIQKHLDDLLVVLGACLIVVGAAMLSTVAAVFTAGAFLIAFGVLVGLGGRKK